MDFFFGMLGALVGFALYHAGVRAGERSPVPAPMERKAVEGLAESQEAFRLLQNYTAEQAYGLRFEGEAEE